jgi:hypothetical protein
MHRLLSLPLLLRGPSTEAVATSGVLIRCIGQPERFARLLGVAGSQKADRAHRWGAAFHPCGVEQADAEAREVHAWAAERFRRSGWTLFPEFVHYRGDVGTLARPRVRRSLASDLRRVDRFGYAAFLARRGQGDWARFRHRMSEPYARRRFGRQAWMPRTLTWLRLRLHGRLLTVERGGEPVAGGVVIRRRDEVWFAALGVMNGDPTLVRDGALLATYRAVYDLADRTEAAVVDAGRCSGWSDDPVGAYKSKWGLRPGRDPLSPLVAVRAVTPRGFRWLATLNRYEDDHHNGLARSGLSAESSLAGRAVVPTSGAADHRVPEDE